MFVHNASFRHHLVIVTIPACSSANERRVDHVNKLVSGYMCERWRCVDVRIDGVCIVGKDGIRDDDARFGVEEKTPIVVFPHGEARNLRTTWYTLTVKDGDTVECPVDGIPAPSVR